MNLDGQTYDSSTDEVRCKVIDGKLIPLELKLVYPEPTQIAEGFKTCFADHLKEVGIVLTLEPSDAVAKLITHSGQEFNLVLEGTVIVTLGDKEFVMNPGDSIYFNPTIPHGQRCGGDVKARFLTVIAE